MNPQLRTLMWKDLGLCRTPLKGAAILFAIPYLIGAYAYATRQWPTEFFLPGIVTMGAVAWVLMGPCAVAVAGNIFASERTLRCADFSLMLPLSRRQIVLSKLLVACACASALWIIGMSAAFIPVLLLDWTATLQSLLRLDLGNDVLYSIPGVLNTAAFACFGVAWLYSTFFSSPTVATVAGITTSIVVGVSVCLANNHFDLTDERRLHILVWVFAGLGLLGLLAGSRCYLSRKTP